MKERDEAWFAATIWILTICFYVILFAITGGSDDDNGNSTRGALCGVANACLPDFVGP